VKLFWDTGWGLEILYLRPEGGGLRDMADSADSALPPQPASEWFLLLQLRKTARGRRMLTTD
jgi:hypothetical protein